jgi:hypothetical protein
MAWLREGVVYLALSENLAVGGRIWEGETMEARKCGHCGQEIKEWVEFCPNCSEPVEGYARPAGFWIRVGAHLIDALIFIPIIILGFWNITSLKSTTVLVLISLPGLLFQKTGRTRYARGVVLRL